MLRDFILKHEKIIGTLASIFAIIMFFSLIEILISNVRGDSAIFIQPIATSINGLFWGAYAYGRRDWFLFVPNILALTLGILTALAVPLTLLFLS
jgi:hypothetical protein